jgi:hypothetical protein
MKKNASIGKAMISLWFKAAAVSLLFVAISSQAADVVNFTIKGYKFSSYRALAKSVCLACHYSSVPNGTDLETPLAKMTEPQIKDYLGPILQSGNMPPNKAYRELAYWRFNMLKRR